MSSECKHALLCLKIFEIFKIFTYKNIELNTQYFIVMIFYEFRLGLNQQQCINKLIPTSVNKTSLNSLSLF